MNKKITFLALACSVCCSLFAATIPADEDLYKMVLASLLAFNAGVQKDDFADLRDTMAKMAQAQLSAEKLQSSFHEFVEGKVDFSRIENLEPIFETRELNNDGLLILNGSYPTTPRAVHFRLKYLQEEGEWKLFGISVDTKQESPGATDAQKKESE